MNYSYAKLWGNKCFCSSDVNRYNIDISKCPIFFCFGNKKGFNFHTKEWADTLTKDEEAGGKSKCKEYDSDHWVM